MKPTILTKLYRAVKLLRLLNKRWLVATPWEDCVGYSGVARKHCSGWGMLFGLLASSSTGGYQKFGFKLLDKQ